MSKPKDKKKKQKKGDKPKPITREDFFDVLRKISGPRQDVAKPSEKEKSKTSD